MTALPSLTHGYFVTGTDTNIGKTVATVALLHYFKQQGISVAGMKPVASGCEWLENGWKNSDALLLQQHSSRSLPYNLINPYAYPLPIAPHIAGQQQPMVMDVVHHALYALQQQAQCVLVEGAGGWYSPLNATLDNAGLAYALDLPVILVVGIRLGCINHARLTWQAIQHCGLNCVGWLAVCHDPTMLQPEASIETLQTALACPLWGVLPYQAAPDFAQLAGYLHPVW